MQIEYTFALDDGRRFEFAVDVDRVFNPAQQPQRAFWTELKFHQCDNCPLSTETHTHCPAAADLQEVIDTFKNIISFETVTLEVRTPERTILKRSDVQTGLRSLAGLVMASSGCPILSRLKGMARFHLPFATLEETVMRTVGAYLVGQFFVYKGGGKPDLDLKGLEAFYLDLHGVDCCFKKRIDAASEKDANMNAIGSLGFLAMGVSFSLEDALKDLQPFSLPGSPTPAKKPIEGT